MKKIALALLCALAACETQSTTPSASQCKTSTDCRTGETCNSKLQCESTRASGPTGPVPIVVSKTIGNEGGTLESNGVTVVIPPGAITKDTQLSLGLRTGDGLPVLPKGLGRVGSVPALLPHGTQFAVPVRVTLPSQFRESTVYRLADEADLEWEPVSRTFKAGPSLVFETSVFSFYTEVGEALKDGESLYELEAPVIQGFNVLRDWGRLVYDRGHVYWGIPTDGSVTLWGLRLDAGPAAPVQIFKIPATVSLAQRWQVIATQNHLVWGYEVGGASGAVSKDGSGYREILTKPPSTPFFSLGDRVVVGGGGPEYPIDVFSPATGASSPLARAFVALVRSACTYDAANDVAGCILGGSTTDGIAGDGVETFNFMTNERKILGRSNELNLEKGRHGTLLQNRTHWFTLSGGFRQGIVAWPKNGGAYRVLEGVGNIDFAYAIDDQAIYFCRGTDDMRGQLIRVTLNEPGDTRIANGCYEVLGVDDTSVYFYERKDISNSPNPRYLFKRIPR
jgi:ZU5 domain